MIFLGGFLSNYWIYYNLMKSQIERIKKSTFIKKYIVFSWKLNFNCIRYQCNSKVSLLEASTLKPIKVKLHNMIHLLTFWVEIETDERKMIWWFSQLSKCSTARGSSIRLSLVGPSKVKAFMPVRFT